MSAGHEQEYVLRTNDDELVRLGLQHRIWAAQAAALWERAGFAPGQTLLDIGCGPGFATLDLARLVGPAGRVLAVDASARFITHLEQQAAALGLANVAARVADVHDLGLAPQSLDGAYARWVLCFVRDPGAVIAQAAAALRPGGKLAVQDYFNYHNLALAPRSAIFERIVAAVDKSWRLHGGDPDIAGQVPALMARAGLRVREIRPILRVGRPSDPIWHWPTTFFRNFVPVLVELGLITAADRAEFDREWAARSADPHTFFSSPPVYDVVGEKPEGDA